jgi:hypothetical protein
VKAAINFVEIASNTDWLVFVALLKPDIGLNVLFTELIYRF